MRRVFGALVAVLLAVTGCSDDVGEAGTQADVNAEPDVFEATEYTDWSEDQTGTTAKPAFDKGCRYKAVDGELWELAADGDNDRLTLTGPATGEVNLTLYVNEGVSPVMLANVELQRTLPGKAYEQATGSLQFGEGLAEFWTVIDGTLCFETSLVDATEDVAGEFSLIAEEDVGDGLRTVGGTFTVSAAAITGSDSLNVNDQAIALDLR
ncbi:MAG: hypothetical protein QF464_18865 [Myxococcota bacterium]|nr:hypothetical protein [Myxococcota bacterium]